MSATMGLYRPVKGITYDPKEMKWSNGKDLFDYIHFYYVDDFHDINRHERKQHEYLRTLCMKYGYLLKSRAFPKGEYILPVEEVAYCQGWEYLFKKRFFKLKESFYYADSKYRMEMLMLKWLNFKSKEVDVGKIYREFMSKWEDEMIFSISW